MDIGVAGLRTLRDFQKIMDIGLARLRTHIRVIYSQLSLDGEQGFSIKTTEKNINNGHETSNTDRRNLAATAPR